MSQDENKPDSPPDRLSMNPSSRFYSEELLNRGIGIRFKGRERTNVQEYCISEGWVKLVAGKQMNRMGKPLTIKSTGLVEAWFEDLLADEDGASADEANADASSEETTVVKTKKTAKPKAKAKAKPTGKANSKPMPKARRKR